MGPDELASGQYLTEPSWWQRFVEWFGSLSRPVRPACCRPGASSSWLQCSWGSSPSSSCGWCGPKPVTRRRASRRPGGGRRGAPCRGSPRPGTRVDGLAATGMPPCLTATACSPPPRSSAPCSPFPGRTAHEVPSPWPRCSRTTRTALRERRLIVRRRPLRPPPHHKAQAVATTELDAELPPTRPVLGHLVGP